MEYYFDNSRYVAACVESIEQMKKKAFSDIKPYIRPYLQFKPHQHKSWEEFKEEWEDLHTTSEMKEMYKELYPDLPYKDWFGFPVFFIIDWRETGIDMDAWDYITTDMIQKWKIGILDLYEIAIANMEACKQRNIIQVIAEEDGNTDLKLYRTKFITQSLAYGASIILSEKIRKRIHQYIKDDYYVFFEGEKNILCIAKKSVMQNEMKEICKVITLAVKSTEQLLDCVLLCERNKIFLV